MTAAETATAGSWQEEVRTGRRFRFGRNWARYSATIDRSRVELAEASLVRMLGEGALQGRTFLDAGCGSGLFSLAARNLGASRVRSFDFDPDSAGCANALREKFRPGDEAWTIEAGSVLDPDYLQSLGTWDIVYSWGVLHHTGDLWRAIDLVSGRAGKAGLFFISIYNDQGVASKRWRAVKRVYSSGFAGQLLVSAFLIPAFVVYGLLKDLLLLRSPVRRYRDYRKERGMSVVFDWIDWLGGYPFEVAKPERVLEFLRARGFELENMTTCGGGTGCNEYLFRRR